MLKMKKFDMSREALQPKVDRSGRRTRPVANVETRRPVSRQDEVFILNDYEVYMEIGGMQIFVNPEFYSHFKIESAEKSLELWHSVSIEDREFVFNKKRTFRFGKPSKEYKEFLKRGESIALELPVIYGCKLLQLEDMSIKELVYTDFLRDRTPCTALLGQCFNHREVPNEVPIVVGNIKSATFEVVCGAEVIIVRTIDGVEYILLDNLETGFDELLLDEPIPVDDDDNNVEEMEVFDDDDEDEDEEDEEEHLEIPSFIRNHGKGGH